MTTTIIENGSDCTSSAPDIRIAALAPATLALLAGLALVWIAGFAQSAAVHAAAHDERHATAFPCH